MLNGVDDRSFGLALRNGIPSVASRWTDSSSVALHVMRMKERQGRNVRKEKRNQNQNHLYLKKFHDRSRLTSIHRLVGTSWKRYLGML